MKLVTKFKVDNDLSIGKTGVGAFKLLENFNIKNPVFVAFQKEGDENRDKENISQELLSSSEELLSSDENYLYVISLPYTNKVKDNEYNKFFDFQKATNIIKEITTYNKNYTT